MRCRQPLRVEVSSIFINKLARFQFQLLLHSSSKYFRIGRMRRLLKVFNCVTFDKGEGGLPSTRHEITFERRQRAFRFLTQMYKSTRRRMCISYFAFVPGKSIQRDFRSPQPGKREYWNGWTGQTKVHGAMHQRDVTNIYLVSDRITQDQRRHNSNRYVVNFRGDPSKNYLL